MNTWTCNKWKANPFFKKGLYIRVEASVDPEVRRAVLEFGRWLRSEYIFPAKVIVYVKASKFVRGTDGELYYGTCLKPGDPNDYPHIKISTGDYPETIRDRGQDNALAAYLECLLEMLTYYFQWVNDMDDMTEEEEMRDAERCANRILKKYATTRDHP